MSNQDDLSILEVTFQLHGPVDGLNEVINAVLELCQVKHGSARVAHPQQVHGDDFIVILHMLDHFGEYCTTPAITMDHHALLQIRLIWLYMDLMDEVLRLSFIVQFDIFLANLLSLDAIQG